MRCNYNFSDVYFVCFYFCCMERHGRPMFTTGIVLDAWSMDGDAKESFDQELVEEIGKIDCEIKEFDLTKNLWKVRSDVIHGEIKQ